MKHDLKKTWTELIRPLLFRPDRVQVAALCYRVRAGETEVLLITSREKRRWIIPKGWPIEGYDALGTALQEAWEEAGVAKGRTSKRSIGRYGYQKKLNYGANAPVSTKVFAIEVLEMRDDFPEAAERQRIWVTPKDAAEMVEEPELRRILSEFRKP